MEPTQQSALRQLVSDYQPNKYVYGGDSFLGSVLPIQRKILKPESTFAEFVGYDDKGTPRYNVTTTPAKLGPAEKGPNILTRALGGALNLYDEITGNPRQAAQGISSALQGQMASATAGAPVYDPQTNQVSEFDPAIFPLMNAPAGLSALRSIKPGETILGAAGTQIASAKDRAAAGKKAAELIKSQPPIKASEALGQLKEKGFTKTTTTQSDRTKVGGGNIGGAAFPAISEADPLYSNKVWGVMDTGTASRLINLTSPTTAWTTMLGSATQLKTNPIVFDRMKRAFISSMKAGNLSDELAFKINKNLEPTFGIGADIRDPQIWKQATTFEKRSALADVMMGQGKSPKEGGVSLGGEKSGKGVIFKPTDILISETEKGLLHPEHGGTAETFSVGPRMFQLGKSAEYRPDLHPGFPTLIEGKDLGVNVIPTPTEVYLPDYHKSFIARTGRKPGYYDLALGIKGEGLPSQNLTDDYIKHLMSSGYAVAGGAVGLSALRQIPREDQSSEQAP